MVAVFVVVYMNCASVTTNKFEDVAPRGGRICIPVITVNLVQQDSKSHELDAAFADDLIGEREVHVTDKGFPIEFHAVCEIDVVVIAIKAFHAQFS